MKRGNRETDYLFLLQYITLKTQKVMATPATLNSKYYFYILLFEHLNLNFLFLTGFLRFQTNQQEEEEQNQRPNNQADNIHWI